MDTFAHFKYPCYEAKLSYNVKLIFKSSVSTPNLSLQDKFNGQVSMLSTTYIVAKIFDIRL